MFVMVRCNCVIKCRDCRTLFNVIRVGWRWEFLQFARESWITTIFTIVFKYLIQAVFIGFLKNDLYSEYRTRFWKLESFSSIVNIVDTFVYPQIMCLLAPCSAYQQFCITIWSSHHGSSVWKFRHRVFLPYVLRPIFYCCLGCHSRQWCAGDGHMNVGFFVGWHSWVRLSCPTTWLSVRVCNLANGPVAVYCECVFQTGRSHSCILIIAQSWGSWTPRFCFLIKPRFM